MKKIKIFLCSILLIILSPSIVNAASGSYSISSNSSVEVGSNISVTFTINAKKLFYWQSYITYDTSKLQLVSGSTNFQGESDSISGQNSVSKTLKFKAKSKGTAWVAIAMGSAGNNIDADAAEISFSKKTKNITINEKKVTPKKEYSSNNYLKSLSVEDAELSPEFNKNTLEYKVELPAGTEKIKINASKEDSTATISGDGEQTVTEGNNKIIIKVIAENGNAKEYIINATVKELSPIEVTINNKKYTIIRKKEQLPKISSTYEEATINIDENEVPALKSNITNYTLIGLKDESGNTNLYIYNQDNKTYLIYNEITFNKLTVVPIENKSIIIPKKYKQAKITINEKKILAYKCNNSYPIFVGMNIETGKVNLYSYDKEENTVQIFNGNVTQQTNEDIYIYIITGLGSFLVFTYVGILIDLIKRAKRNN